MNDDDVISRRRVLEIFAGVIGVGVVLSLIAWGLLALREWQLRPSRRFSEQQLPPPHRVAEIRQEMFAVVPARPAMFAAQAEALETWGWADQRRRVVRVPIETAIDLELAGVKP